jgi:hypothetical protein
MIGIRRAYEVNNKGNMTAYSGGRQEMRELLRACGVSGSFMFPFAVYIRGGAVVNAATGFQNAVAIEAAIRDLAGN